MKWTTCRVRGRYKYMTLEVVKPHGKPTRWWFNIYETEKNLSLTHKDMIHDYDTKEEAKEAALLFAKRFFKAGVGGSKYTPRTRPRPVSGDTIQTSAQAGKGRRSASGGG